MKKRFYFMTIIMLSATVLNLSSCLKDDSHYINFAGAGATIELPIAAYYGLGKTIPEALAISATPVTIPLIVNVASPKPLGSAVSVTLALDPAALAAYNTANGTAYNILPPADYSIAAWTVTVPANQREATLNININTSLVDPSQQFVLPVSIASASGQTVNQFKTALLLVQAKNQYDGTYSVKGFVFRNLGGVNDPVLGGFFKGYTQSLSTLSANMVTWAPLWNGGSQAGGVGGTTLTVNANNSVTVVSSGNPTLANDPAYNNRYDPATKIFYISYKWGTANPRAETDTLTYTGP